MQNKNGSWDLDEWIIALIYLLAAALIYFGVVNHRMTPEPSGSPASGIGFKFESVDDDPPSNYDQTVRRLEK